MSWSQTQTVICSFCDLCLFYIFLVPAVDKLGVIALFQSRNFVSNKLSISCLQFCLLVSTNQLGAKLHKLIYDFFKCLLMWCYQSQKSLKISGMKHKLTLFHITSRYADCLLIASDLDQGFIYSGPGIRRWRWRPCRIRIWGYTSRRTRYISHLLIFFCGQISTTENVILRNIHPKFIVALASNIKRYFTCDSFRITQVV